MFKLISENLLSAQSLLFTYFIHFTVIDSMYVVIQVSISVVFT